MGGAHRKLWPHEYARLKMVLVSIRPAAGCLKIDLDVVFCEQCRVSVSLNQVAQSRQRAEEARHGNNAKHQVNCENTRNCMKVVALSSCVITLTQCLSLVFPAHPHDTFGCVETGASSPTTWSCRVHLWTLWCSNKVFVKGNLWLAQRSQVQLTDTVTMSKCSIYVFWTWQLGLCSRISCSIAGWKQFVFRLKNYTSCSNVCTPPGDGEEEPQPRLAGVGTVTSRKEGQRAGGHPETPTQQGGRGRFRR